MNVSNRTITVFTSREFNQDTARAKRAAEKGPLFITTRGEASHVLMSIEEYRPLEERPMTLREALMDPNGDDFDYDFPQLSGVFKRFAFEIEDLLS